MAQSPFASSHNSSQHKQCFECGAVLNIGDKSCWMCHAEQPLVGKLIVPKAVPVTVTAAAENPWFVHVGIWVGIITAVLVAYGVLRSGDGLLATLFLLAAV